MSIMPRGTPVSRLQRLLRIGVPAFVTLVWTGLALLVICAIAGAVLHLYRTYAATRDQAQTLEQQVRLAEIQRDKLAGRLHYLNSPNGRVATIIEHGGGKQNDQVVTFTPQLPAPAPPPAVAHTQTAAEDNTMGGLALAALVLFLLAFLTGIAFFIYRWRHLARRPRPGDMLTPRSELSHR